MTWHLIELALYAVAATVMVVTHRRMTKRLEAAAVNRAAALQKQAKAVQRIKLQAVSEFHEMRDRTQHMHEDTRLMHDRADTLLREVNEQGARR